MDDSHVGYIGQASYAEEAWNKRTILIRRCLGALASLYGVVPNNPMLPNIRHGTTAILGRFRSTCQAAHNVPNTRL